MIVIALILLAAVVVALSPLVPLWVVVTVLVLVRAVGDWGLSTGQSPLPGGLLSGAVGLGFLVAVLLPGGRAVPFRFMQFGLAAAAWCALFGAVAVITTDATTAPVEEAVRLMSVVATALVVSRCNRSGLRKLSAGLLCAILIPALIQLVTWTTMVPRTFDSGDRVAGSFSHPNAAAAYFAFGVLYAWAVARRSNGAFPRVVAVVSLLAAFSTQSLGAIVGLLVAGLVVRIVSPGNAMGRRLGEVVALLLAAIVLALMPPIAARLEEFRGLDLNVTGTSQDSANSMEWRIVNWYRLLESWVEAPWFGHGLGATSYAITPLGAPPHSAPIQILVETGLVGLLPVSLGLLSLAIWARRRMGRDKVGGGLVLGVVVFAAVNGAESNLLNYTPALYLATAVCALELVRTSSGPAVKRRRLRSRAPMKEYHGRDRTVELAAGVEVLDAKERES